MSVTANLTTNVETITATIVVEDETIIAQVNTAARGPAGEAGSAVVDAATQSDGTADLDLLNVETVTATVTGTLTADHIHGNLAGSVYAHIRAGENLAKGDPVYVSSSHGSGSTLIPIVSKADASNAAKMPAIGIMDEAVLANANGHMVITGTITELDTAGLTVNAELYVAEGGGMTATPPTARAQPVARVERVNANNGAVIVKVNGLSASDATGNTLVRRDANGGASLEYPTFGSGFQITESGGSDTFGMRSATGDTWSMYGPDYGDFMSFSKAGVINFSPSGFSYGAGAASAHRTALGLGTGDSPTFTQITVNAGSRASNLGGVKFADQFDLVSLVTNSDFGLTRSNVARIVLGQSGVGMRQDGVVSWTGTTEATNAKELSLLRDAANTLAQRNGLNQQESRIYGTYSDNSNYRRLALKMSTAGVAQIVAEGAGSGASGNRIEIDGLRIGKGGGDVATNTALGVSALNANTSGSSNSAFGNGALLTNTTGSNNSAVGHEALRNNTTGGSNSAVGREALLNNTTGSSNTAVGYFALIGNTTGSNNAAVGTQALRFNSTGVKNSAIGVEALRNNGTGGSNSAVGFASLFNNTTGSNNSAVGVDSGRFIADGTTANAITANSVYLGNDTKALANNQTNQIVIGYDATGIGSNTAVLGNDNIVTTALKGNVGIGTTSPSAMLDVNSDTVRVRTARTPASAAAPGNAGDICWDADYIYVCTATDTWKRTAISTWP